MSAYCKSLLLAMYLLGMQACVYLAYISGTLSFREEKPIQPEITVTPLLEETPQDPCLGYDGVLRIRSGDMGAAAGTVFFLYMVNHLLYAEKYNLLPWAHLDNTSYIIYDHNVHGAGPSHTFQMINGEIEMNEIGIPQPPRLPTETEKTSFTVTGNGVWDSYFEPLSGFTPFNKCWTDKPLYEIDLFGVSWGLHREADWAVRAWGYGPFKKSDAKLTVREWYRPMRQRAASVVRRYFQPKPWLREAADRANPLEPGHSCLAMHVRLTDKELSGGRREVRLEDFLPYVTAFLKNDLEHRHVYLATDSASTLSEIHSTWPAEISSRVITQESAFLSNSSDPTFHQESHHRTNSEVLTDIYAMSKCTALLHGRSAVSESVFYVNPELREASIDLEGDEETLEELRWGVTNSDDEA